MPACSVTIATRDMRPLQLGHSRTSTENVRRRSSAHGRYVRRPVLVLSAEEVAEVRAMLIVAPANVDISRRRRLGWRRIRRGSLTRGSPARCPPRPERILCDWLIALPRSTLIERAGALSAAKMRQLEDVLRLARLDRARWGG